MIQMTFKGTLTGCVSILVMATATWFTLMTLTPQDHPKPVTSEQPDAYMEDVSAVFMDQFGKPKMKIVTPKLTHYLNNDTTQLDDPQLTIYRQSPTPWYISSHYAKATHGIDNVDFRENVTIHHPADANMPATIIKAPTLIVHPTDQTAETNEEIELIQPNIIVKAMGMRANMNSGNIQLLSKARGEYVPDAQ